MRFRGGPPDDAACRDLCLESDLRAYRQRARDAEEALLRSRKPGTRPSLPIDRYAGDYQQPLLGRLRITRQASGALTLQVGDGLVGSVEHREGDQFRVVWRNPIYGRSMLAVTVAEGVARKIKLEEMGEFVRAAGIAPASNNKSIN